MAISRGAATRLQRHIGLIVIIVVLMMRAVCNRARGGFAAKTMMMIVAMPRHAVSFGRRQAAGRSRPGQPFGAPRCTAGASHLPTDLRRLPT